MYLMYADESGNTGTDYDNKEQPIFVLGSVSLEHTNWHKNNDYFNERKIEIFTFYVCQYLNIVNGNKKYSEFKEKHCIYNYNKLITKTNKNYLI